MTLFPVRSRYKSNNDVITCPSLHPPPQPSTNLLQRFFIIQCWISKEFTLAPPFGTIIITLFFIRSRVYRRGARACFLSPVPIRYEVNIIK